MKILQLNIRNFRGFSEFEMKPNGHVLVMGEPGSGKSDVINALVRLLYPYSDRLPTTEFDFHHRNVEDPIAIEAVIGELSADLKQEFFDEIEYWDSDIGALVEESQTISELEKPQYIKVIRLGYRMDWTDGDDIQPVQRYYPKYGGARAAQLTRTTRTKIQRLGFAYALGIQSNPLSLAPRSVFRRIIDASNQDDFEASTNQYVDAVADSATVFSSADEVRRALRDVLAHTRPSRDDLDPAEQADTVIFTPTELSHSSLLRALEPSFFLGGELGHVPRSRLGTTLTQSLGISEALATTGDVEGILAIDDLGDGLDAATAQHLATAAINRTGQCWITTRSGAIAEAFEPSEVVRLSVRRDGHRRFKQGWTHERKHDLKMVRNWYHVLAPVLSHRAVAVVEGPSDFATLHALGLILGREAPKSTPASHGLAIVSAAEQGSGGYQQALNLAQYAAQMGIKAVAVVDGDPANRHYSNQTCEHYGISIVRLPDRIEIEKAILDGVSITMISKTVAPICDAYGIDDNGIQTCEDSEVVRIATKLIKKHNLHRSVVEALIDHADGNLLFRLMQSIIEVSKLRTPEFVQL